jgi:hypothetical protein
MKTKTHFNFRVDIWDDQQHHSASHRHWGFRVSDHVYHRKGRLARAGLGEDPDFVDKLVGFTFGNMAYDAMLETRYVGAGEGLLRAGAHP